MKDLCGKILRFNLDYPEAVTLFDTSMRFQIID